MAHHNFGKRYETISIIAWVLNWGSIPLYDYSWGEGSPPTYSERSRLAISMGHSSVVKRR